MSRVVIVSGLSGSGKTLAVKSLEDMGYFAVDNLPVPLIPSFVDLLDRSEGEAPLGALVVDAREKSHLSSVPQVLAELRERPGLDLAILFLEASEETLVRRFSASRRPHPLLLSEHTGIVDAIRLEQELLEPLRASANRVIATDELSPHDLRRIVQQEYLEEIAQTELRVQVQSFGFKYGAPRECDMIFDVRFLTNPFFEPTLKKLSGLDRPIVEFLNDLPDFEPFLKKLEDLLEFVMPRYVDEGKSYLTICIGCTGGRHRSVAISERLGKFLQQLGYRATVSHRDLVREAEPEKK